MIYILPEKAYLNLALFQSKSISDAVYESLWYDLSPSENRVLLLVIVRSQKRLTITAGNVTDLTLEGFTNVRRMRRPEFPAAFNRFFAFNLIARAFIVSGNESLRLLHVSIIRNVLDCTQSAYRTYITSPLVISARSVEYY